MRIELRHGRRIVAQDHAANFARAPAIKRKSARGHFVEHGPEREQIASYIDVLGSDLFGRHISYRAEHRSRAGHVGRIIARQRFGFATAEADFPVTLAKPKSSTF